MTCADLEILLADYVDGTLYGEVKAAAESHLAACPGCAELARDAAGAVAFMERAPNVEAPPELVTCILFEIGRSTVKPSWLHRWFGKWLDPVLQPRFVMGMAMTVLSFAMLGRLSGIEVRQLKPSDLDPVKVWMTAEDRLHRAWERTVKHYNSLRLVFQIQAQLNEWSEEQQADAGDGKESTRECDKKSEVKRGSAAKMSSEAKVVGYCRVCGKPLDEATVRSAQGTIFCEEHLPIQHTPPSATAAESSPYTAPSPPPLLNESVSPGLAFVLGLIPGVGAIYNGQYAKGLVHVVIIGLIISILSSGYASGFEPLMSLLLAAFWFYMAFEAYHTAKRRQQGQMVDEFSSLIPMRGARLPLAPVILIAIGVRVPVG